MKKLTLALLPIGLTACTGWAPVDNVNVANYQDLPSMLDAEFSDPLFVQVNANNINGLKSLPPSNEKIFLKPINALRGLCEQQGGVLKQEDSLEHGAQFIKDNTGIFICEEGHAGLWGGKIKLINPRYSNPSIRVVNVSEVNALEYLDKKIADQLALTAYNLKRERVLEAAEDTFEEKRYHQKNVGMNLCNWSNSIGIVREVTPVQIRLIVVGKLPYADDGFLFRPGVEKITFNNINKEIWDSKNNWAECPYIISQK